MQALGLIEVVGLTAGIEAADVACKTADVELVGYELAKGGGYVTIKVLGQVGAVTAAVDAAAASAERITRVVSRHVIPRPADGLDTLVHSATTVGYEAPAPEPTKAPAKKAPAAKASPAKAAPAQPTEGKPAEAETPVPAKATKNTEPEAPAKTRAPRKTEGKQP